MFFFLCGPHYDRYSQLFRVNVFTEIAELFKGVHCLSNQKCWQYCCRSFMVSMDEQKAIVEILGQLLGSTIQAKEIAENVIENIEIMKKAVLARAFRGELGTNDPAEESAVELLKSVL